MTASIRTAAQLAAALSAATGLAVIVRKSREYSRGYEVRIPSHDEPNPAYDMTVGVADIKTVAEGVEYFDRIVERARDVDAADVEFAVRAAAIRRARAAEAAAAAKAAAEAAEAPAAEAPAAAATPAADNEAAPAPAPVAKPAAATTAGAPAGPTHYGLPLADYNRKFDALRAACPDAEPLLVDTLLRMAAIDARHYRCRLFVEELRSAIELTCGGATVAIGPWALEVAAAFVALATAPGSLWWLDKDDTLLSAIHVRDAAFAAIAA